MVLTAHDTLHICERKIWQRYPKCRLVIDARGKFEVVIGSACDGG